jgi:hypothetical protein
MVRIVGTITPSASGSTVDYKIELIPAALIAAAASLVIALPILLVLIARGYLPSEVLVLLVVIVLFVAAINLLISEWQAKWLRDYVASTCQPDLKTGS